MMLAKTDRKYTTIRTESQPSSCLYIEKSNGGIG